ncbi:hypothetical protein ERJ75_000631600 [Trypanosoma vivax]|nr:hypothetical protein ERJ75_000631600 [Trypanosoma vivax]
MCAWTALLAIAAGFACTARTAAGSGRCWGEHGGGLRADVRRLRQLERSAGGFEGRRRRGEGGRRENPASGAKDHGRRRNKCARGRLDWQRETAVGDAIARALAATHAPGETSAAEVTL